MCGIVGVVSSDPRALPRGHERLRAMTDVIRHRGPDDDGHLCEPGIALGMRRLSVIDVAGSAQPLANEDGSVWTVFNGEIFEYQPLRAELAARGHVLSTEGDTETIVHLYEEHGHRFPTRLRGMYGIAVWDRPRRRLVLTRDRMGVKPLYTVEGPWGLAFASEVKSLIVGGFVEPRLDPEAAELFLALGYVPGPLTLFAGVRKLPPATTLVWEDGRRVAEEPYWSPWDDPPARAGQSREEDREELLRRLRRAVRARMVSDVPLGLMLSGGLDSSLIAALMGEVSDRPVETFSIGFREDGRANELDDARAVARELGTNHHELMTSAVDHPELLDDVLWHLEEPVADLSPLGFHLLCRLTREHVTVALSGQGADELLGGYRKHLAAARLPARLPAPARAALRAAAAGAGDREAARALAAAAAATPAERVLAMSRVAPPRGSEARVAAALAAHDPGRAATVLGQTLELDRRTALVDLMFLYFDKASMAASLEVRVPFMDHDVAALCAALPDDRKVHRGEGKALLREAARGLVPDAVLARPKRNFFRSAVDAWLAANRPLVAETLAAARARGAVPVPEALASVGGGDGGRRAGERVLVHVLLERWQQLFVDRSRAVAVASGSPDGREGYGAAGFSPVPMSRTRSQSSGR